MGIAVIAALMRMGEPADAASDAERRNKTCPWETRDGCQTQNGVSLALQAPAFSVDSASSACRSVVSLSCWLNSGPGSQR